MTMLARRLRAAERRRRGRRIAKKVSVIIIALSVVAASAGVFLFSKKFEITSVAISGLAQIPEEDMRVYVDEWLSQERFFFFSERSSWLLDSVALAEGLKASFPQIRNVNVRKSFPNELSVEVEEYSGWGVLCRGEPEECFWIDKAGVAFERAPGFSGLIVPKVRDERARDVKLGSSALSAELVRFVGYFNSRAVSDADLQSVEFTIDAEEEIVRVKTRAGWEILLAQNADPERAYKNLRTAIDGDIKGRTADLLYIDLRFGNRVFYKFK